jgi:hypothetical protein
MPKPTKKEKVKHLLPPPKPDDLMPTAEDIEKLKRITINDRVFLELNPLSPRKLFSIVIKF